MVKGQFFQTITPRGGTPRQGVYLYFNQLSKKLCNFGFAQKRNTKIKIYSVIKDVIQLTQELTVDARRI